MNRKFRKKHFVYYFILIIFTFLQIFPFYLRIVESLQDKSFLPKSGKIYLWPEHLTFDNYLVAWNTAKLGRGYVNSLIYVSIYTAVSAVIVIVVGYFLAKKTFRGRNFIFIMLMSTMMVPGEILLIPNYLLVKELGLLNNLAGLIIPGLVSVFGIFLAKQFFITTIPDSVLESAYIDGASESTIIGKIVFPLSGPVVATYVITTFTAMWNEYLWPQIVLSKSKYYPVQLSLLTFETQFSTSYNSILEAAGMIITVLPIIIVFLIFQNKFVEGINLTGNK